MLGMFPATYLLAEFQAINAQLAPLSIDIAGWFQSFPSEPLLYSTQYTTSSTIKTIPMSTRIPEAALNTYTGGSQDAVLNSDADTAKADGRLILCNLAHEFNGDWYAYGYTHETPAQFIAGWRHIVDTIRARGATNVQFVWAPNIWPAATVVDPTDYYPGDDYVDYIGLDGYMNLECAVFTFEDLFLSNYQTLTALSPKPFLIGEMGVADDVRVDKAQWFRDAFATVRDKMPRCVAVCYFDRDSTGNGEGDYRLETPADALVAFQKSVSTPPMVPQVAPVSGILPGAVEGTAVITTDSRLSNARTPTVHHTTHNTGQSDVIAPGDIGAAVAGAAPTAHAASHGVAQSDVLTPAAIGAAPATGIAAGAITGTAVVTADTRLSDARKPSQDFFGGFSSLWLPTNAKAENFPRVLGMNNDYFATSGTLGVFIGPLLKAGVAYSSITFCCGGTGGATTTHQWFCLLDQSRNVLAKTTDNIADMGSWSPKTIAFPSSYTPGTDIQTYFGVVICAATMPGLRWPYVDSIIGGQAPKIMGKSTTGLTTPASLGATAGAISDDKNVIPWGCVS